MGARTFVKSKYIFHIKSSSNSFVTLCGHHWPKIDFKLDSLKEAKSLEKEPVIVRPCKKCIKIAEEAEKPKVYAHHLRTSEEQKAWRIDFEKRKSAHEEKARQYSIWSQPAALLDEGRKLLDEDTEMLERLDNYKPSKKEIAEMKRLAQQRDNRPRGMRDPFGVLKKKRLLK